MIEELIFSVVIEAVIKETIAALPFLAWPVINPLFIWAVQKIAHLIYEELSWQVEFQWIGYETEEQKKKFEKAADFLKNDPHNKELQDSFKSTLRELIHVKLRESPP